VNRLAIILCTGFGAGYSPFAPGTAGSMVGIVIAWLLWFTELPYAVATAALVFAAVGFWAAERGAVHFADKDPGPVVIDEIAGQLLTLALLPHTWQILVASFFLFRLLDIWKPFPGRQLEKLHGGVGIMADDLAVAVYGNLLLHAVVVWAPRWAGVA
jgi:phosphatidylglycerophosphatase A